MIKIYQINDSNPEFIELQLFSFKKHLQEDFEFIIFNNEAFAKVQKKSKEVTDLCRSLSIRIIEPQKDQIIEAAYVKNREPVFNISGRYTRSDVGFNYALQWAWEKVISKEQGPICFLHSDVFLMEPVKLTDYLQEYTLCFYTRNAEDGTIPQIWEAFFLANMSKMPNPETIVWFPSFVEGQWTDTGGPTYYWLRDHPDTKRFSIPTVVDLFDDLDLDFHPSRYQIFGLPDGKKVLHYFSGSRWCTDWPHYWNFSKEKSEDYHAKKLAWARKMVG
jgi:hypothetical protein